MMPFTQRLLQEWVQASYSIRTNKDEEFYLLSRGKFTDIMSRALTDLDLFVQNRFSKLRNYYLSVSVNTVIEKTCMGAALYRERGAFTKIIREVHRIIESRLAELNISIVYNIDQLCRSIRESAYTGGVILEKIQDQVNSMFDQIHTSQLLSKAEWEDRNNGMPKQVHQVIRDIVFKAHNDNMSMLQSKMQKILEDDVKILDQKGKILTPEEAEIQDEKIAKLNQYYYRLKEQFRKRLANDEVRINREHYQLDQDQISIEQVKKLIRELTVREGLLKTEESTGKIEMEALRQQNTVLERDIHTCNFERVNLTRQLQKQKEKLEKLRMEAMGRKDQSSKKYSKVIEELSSGESDTGMREPQSSSSEFKASYGKIDQVNGQILPPVRTPNTFMSSQNKFSEAGSKRTTTNLPEYPGLKKSTKTKRAYKFENGRLQTAYKFD